MNLRMSERAPAFGRGESHCGAQGRSDDVFLKADLYHCGGDAELCRRDEARRQRLTRGQRAAAPSRAKRSGAARIRQTGLCEVKLSASSGAIPDAEEEDR